MITLVPVCWESFVSGSSSGEPPWGAVPYDVLFWFDWLNAPRVENCWAFLLPFLFKAKLLISYYCGYVRGTPCWGCPPKTCCYNFLFGRLCPGCYVTVLFRSLVTVFCMLWWAWALASNSGPSCGSLLFASMDCLWVVTLFWRLCILLIAF